MIEGTLRCGLWCASASVAWLASAAVAGPWEVFADRCLAPMEHFMPGRTDGLRPTEANAAGDAAEEGTLVFKAGRDGAILQVSPGPICRVSVESANSDLLRPALDWQAEALASGRYVETADGALESNLWREPRLAVRILVDQTRGITVFSAEETDLES